MSGERQRGRNRTDPGDELPSPHQLRPLATSGRSNHPKIADLALADHLIGSQRQRLRNREAELDLP
jgi:hypothetical protein